MSNAVVSPITFSDTPTLGNYVASGMPDYAEMSRCTHCGLCLDFCPTYRVLGVEMDSPRGRIYQMKAVAEGRRTLDEVFDEHMNACLACRACETACPATLKFGQMVEAARWQVEAARPRPWSQRLLRRVIFQELIPHRNRLRLLGRGLRLFQVTGLQSLVRRSGILNLLPDDIRKVEPLTPVMPKRFFDERHYPRVPAFGPKRATIALFSGCVMPVAFGPTNEATVRVLVRNGCEVLVPQAQTCCGALAIHAGERPTGQDLARRNIDAFNLDAVDAIIINAAGCGIALKEYGELLHDDPKYAEKAKAFAAKVKDVSEFLVGLGLIAPQAGFKMTVTYQDACHLAHGQKIRTQPRTLLKAIPGLEIVEMRDSDRCCGSAGIYNITHPDLAVQVLDEKMQSVIATGAHMIVAGNPGCLMQLASGCRTHHYEAETAHTIDLLDRAYALEQTQGGR